MFDALSPQRRRLVVGAAIALLLMIMAVVMISVIRLIADSPHPVSQTDPGPVLLVPGYGGNVQSLEPLAEALRSSGRTAVIVDPVGDGTGDLRAQAEHLGEVADRVREDTGAASVDVIGYSAGGAVARLWVRWLDKKIVVPSFFSCRRSRRISWMPCGSRPLVGSSKINRGGRRISAAANPSRCRIPCEYVRTGRRSAALSPTARAWH